MLLFPNSTSRTWRRDWETSCTRSPSRCRRSTWLLIRCLGVLEGVAIQVDPGFRIVNDAYPYVAARLLTDEAPELRRALTNLLFKDQKPQWRRFEALLNRASSSSEYDASAVAALTSSRP